MPKPKVKRNQFLQRLEEKAHTCARRALVMYDGRTCFDTWRWRDLFESAVIDAADELGIPRVDAGAVVTFYGAAIGALGPSNTFGGIPKLS